MYDVGAYPNAQYGGGKRPLFLQEHWYDCTASLMKGGGQKKMNCEKWFMRDLLQEQRQQSCGSKQSRGRDILNKLQQTRQTRKRGERGDSTAIRLNSCWVANEKKVIHDFLGSCKRVWQVVIQIYGYSSLFAVIEFRLINQTGRRAFPPSNQIILLAADLGTRLK